MLTGKVQFDMLFLWTGRQEIENGTNLFTSDEIRHLIGLHTVFKHQSQESNTKLQCFWFTCWISVIPPQSSSDTFSLTYELFMTKSLIVIPKWDVDNLHVSSNHSSERDALLLHCICVIRLDSATDKGTFYPPPKTNWTIQLNIESRPRLSKTITQ